MEGRYVDMRHRNIGRCWDHFNYLFHRGTRGRPFALALKDARNAYFISALLGMLSAAFVECRALAVGRWAYNDKMPIVPYLHLGMWPLLQLTLLVPASIWLAALWFRRSEFK